MSGTKPQTLQAVQMKLTCSRKTPPPTFLMDYSALSLCTFVALMLLKNRTCGQQMIITMTAYKDWGSLAKLNKAIFFIYNVTPRFTNIRGRNMFYLLYMTSCGLFYI